MAKSPLVALRETTSTLFLNKKATYRKLISSFTELDDIPPGYAGNAGGERPVPARFASPDGWNAAAAIAGAQARISNRGG